MITSKDNKKIKYLFKLYNDKKFREMENAFIVESYNVVEEAQNAGILKEVYSLKEEKKYPNSIIITKEILEKITDSITPQGIIGVCERRLNNKLGEKILYLDHLQDPQNVGALLRSARAFEFDTLVLDNCVDLLNPKTIRVSEGNLFHLNFVSKSIDELKELGYTILATSMNGKELERYTEKDKKVVLVLGNEGNGVSKSILKKSDLNLTIKMKDTESLNVAVAGAIIMHHLSYEIK